MTQDQIDNTTFRDKLPVDVKEKWLEALRSGIFIQTTGALYDGKDDEGRPKMCCLGVLEHICGTPIEQLAVFKDDGTIHDNYAYCGSVKSAKSPSFMIPAISSSPASILSILNDGDLNKGIKPLSFAEIADYIEKKL